MTHASGSGPRRRPAPGTAAAKRPSPPAAVSLAAADPAADPSLPTRTPRTARGEATRRRLLESAERLFGLNGFHATSIGEVTRAAGVAQGTFYLYFDSKEAIFRALVLNLSHELRLALHRATEHARDRMSMEEAGVRAFLDFVSAHHDLYRIVFESQFIDPGLLRSYYERIADGYTRGLERSMERGEVWRGDAETIAYCLMGASHFLGMRWVVWDGREPPAAVLETMLSFIRRALAPVDRPRVAAEGRT